MIDSVRHDDELLPAILERKEAGCGQEDENQESVKMIYDIV
jgi:hypothetical protein